VSDTDYFEDLRDNIGLFSASYVPRDLSLDYSHEYFNVGVRANEYQIIDDFLLSRPTPYERKPSAYFYTNLPDGPFNSKYGFYASFNDFTAENRLEGSRTALNPYVELPFENIWGYVKPRVSVHHRSYSLDDVTNGAEDSPSFTVPIFSVDAGIFLEKNTNWFGEAALQTLEPRLYYVYAPDEDQSDVPIFDTAPINFNNFSNIFRENRFYGEDRVGDTNQITFGLTSRIIDNETGDERVRISIGQLYLIDDLEQNINANTVIESGLGDLLAEVRTQSADAWSTYAFVQYDHDESDIRNARLAVAYEPQDDDRKRVEVGYYLSKFGDFKTDQLTLSFTWPISDRWQIFGDERYSIEDSESLYTRVGIEYNNCCWKLRLIGQERLQNRNIEEKRSSVFLELELTSLGSFRTGL
ncbi:MAG: LPS-assembly protein LptD, partial [Pseudomonadota bacterium]